MTQDELLGILDSAEIHRLLAEFLGSDRFRQVVKEIVLAVTVEVDAAARLQVPRKLVAYCHTCGGNLRLEGGELRGNARCIPENVQALIRLYREEVIQFLKELPQTNGRH